MKCRQFNITSLFSFNFFGETRHAKQAPIFTLGNMFYFSFVRLRPKIGRISRTKQRFRCRTRGGGRLGRHH